MGLIKKITTMNIFNIFKKKKKICKTDEYCPIYLSYLDKYKENSKEIKYCKNPDKQYCSKYRLIDQTEWKNMSKEEKITLVKKISLIDFIDKQTYNF